VPDLESTVRSPENVVTSSASGEIRKILFALYSIFQAPRKGEGKSQRARKKVGENAEENGRKPGRNAGVAFRLRFAADKYD